MRAAVIINPIAGRSGPTPSAGVSERETVRAWFAERGLDGEVVLTTRPGDAARLAGDYVARGFDRLIAWGGDGTVNEVAGPLIGSRVILGIVRAGSGDGLARGLGIPVDADRALDAAVTLPPIHLDVGWLGPRHFLNVGGLGFDAVVARAFNERRTRGVAGYVAAGARALWSYRSPSYRVQLEDDVIAGPQLLVAFANSREYGNGFTLAPDANPTDGLLDAVVVSGGSIAGHMWRGWWMYIAPRAPVAGVIRRQVHRAAVADGPHLAHVDGEAFEAEGPVAVRVQPAALRVAAPQPGSPKAGGG